MPSLPRIAPSQTHLSLARSHAASSFDYVLPSSRIATHPLPNRTSSKLLVVPHGDIPRHKTFPDLPGLLPRDAMIVLNASRVIPARLRMRKRATHGQAELLLLAPSAQRMDAMDIPAHGQVWSAYIGGRRVRAGDMLEKAVAGSATLFAEVVERDAQGATVRLLFESERDGAASLKNVLDWAGETPLPPYIKRRAEEGDREAYQTVYATTAGSVAAPTAGLHLTERVLDALRDRGVALERVVLHVGAGTFAPVDADVIGMHEMHEEVVRVETGNLRNIARHIAKGRPVVAMGTTSVRTLESLYWFGTRLLCGERAEFDVDQWEPYERLDQMGERDLPSPTEALEAMLKWSGLVDGPIFGKTRLLIVPGYPFKMVDALVTNFHQPRSTLLMLVSAFHGGEPEDLFRVYDAALENGYRFLSYGDSSIYASAEFFKQR